MAKQTSNLAASNQLSILVTTISKAQQWKQQVSGAYSFLYLHAQKDFVHKKDLAQWIKTGFSTHKHIDSKGGPTTPPTKPTKLSDTFAKLLLIPAKPLGKIRQSVTALMLATEFSLAEKLIELKEKLKGSK